MGGTGSGRHSCVSAESPDPRPPVGSGSGRQAVRTLRTPVPLPALVYIKALFSFQKILQNFSDFNHIKSLDVCMGY